jgi:phage replication O-like protein O
MANPQKEDGYTAIANEIMDALISSDLSGQDFKIALLIIRKTYGFNKCEDAVSLSQMMESTGMCKIRCSQVVNRLQLMKILTVTENINGIGKKYKFNKNFDIWETVNKNINRLEKTKLTVNKNINHKRQYTKDKEKNILFPDTGNISCPHQKIIDLYHEILPQLPKVKFWTEIRKRTLQSRWREDKERQSLEWWKSYFGCVKASPFLLGENDRQFRVDLEWLIAPRNMPKVLEGKYVRKEERFDWEM